MRVDRRRRGVLEFSIVCLPENISWLPFISSSHSLSLQMFSWFYALLIIGEYGESRTIMGGFPIDEHYRDVVVMQLKHGDAVKTWSDWKVKRAWEYVGRRGEEAGWKNCNC
ncbi:hypothetical protein L1887_15261 [Cichorium endivia]|nr:hypothetical protein L1887_15261 [Cichorium endivia]